VSSETQDANYKQEMEQLSARLQAYVVQATTSEAANRRMTESLAFTTQELICERELSDGRQQRQRQVVEHLQQRIQEQDKQIMSLQKDFQTAEDDHISLVLQLRQDLLSTQKEASVKSNAFDHLKHSNDSCVMSLQAAIHEKAVMGASRLDLELENKELKNQLDNLRENVRTLRHSFEELTDSTAQLRQKEQAAEENVQRYKQENIHQRQQVLQLGHEKEELVAGKQQIECLLNETTLALQKLQGTMEEMIRTQGSECSRFQSELFDKDMLIRSLTDELLSVRSQSFILQNEVVTLKEKCEASGVQVGSLVSQLEQLSEVAQSLLSCRQQCQLEIFLINDLLERTQNELQNELVRAVDMKQVHDKEILQLEARRNTEMTYLQKQDDKLASRMKQVLQSMLGLIKLEGQDFVFVTETEAGQEVQLCDTNTLGSKCTDITESDEFMDSNSQPHIIELFDVASQLRTKLISVLVHQRDRQSDYITTVTTLRHVALQLNAMLTTANSPGPRAVVDGCLNPALVTPTDSQDAGYSYPEIELIASYINPDLRVEILQTLPSEIVPLFETTASAAEALVHRVACEQHTNTQLVLEITRLSHELASMQQEKYATFRKHTEELELLHGEINQFGAESDTLCDIHERQLQQLTREHEEEMADTFLKAEKKILEEAERLARIFEDQAKQFIVQKRDLQQGIEAMSQLVAHDKERIELINTQFEELRDKIASAERTLSSKDSIIDAQSVEIRKMNEQLKGIETTFTSMVQASTTELGRKDAIIKSQAVALDEIKTALMGLKGEYVNKFTQARDELKGREQQLLECSSCLDQQQEQLHRLNMQVKELAAQNKDLEDEKASLHGMLAYLRDENNTLQNSVNTLVADKTGLQESTKVFVIEIGELRAHNAELSNHLVLVQVLFAVWLPSMLVSTVFWQDNLTEKLNELEALSGRLQQTEFQAAAESRKRLDLENKARGAVNADPPVLAPACLRSQDVSKNGALNIPGTPQKAASVSSPRISKPSNRNGRSASFTSNVEDAESSDSNDSANSPPPLSLQQLMSAKIPIRAERQTASDPSHDTAATDTKRSQLNLRQPVRNDVPSTLASDRPKERNSTNILDGSLFRKIRGRSPHRVFAGNTSNSQTPTNSIVHNNPLVSIRGSEPLMNITAMQSLVGHRGDGVVTGKPLIKVAPSPAHLDATKPGSHPVIVSTRAVEARIVGALKNETETINRQRSPNDGDSALHLSELHDLGKEDLHSAATTIPTPSVSSTTTSSRGIGLSNKEQYIKQWTDTTSARIERAIQMKGWKLSSSPSATMPTPTEGDSEHGK
jgi:myosin heavy subunit